MAAAQTVLAAAITTTVQASCTVGDFLGFPTASAFTALVDSEYLRITAGYGTTTWTISRGYAGSTAATHSLGATVTCVSDGYTDLGRIKTLQGITVTTYDAILAGFISAVNGEITRRVGGIFMGPATDTLRLYDGASATRNFTSLWIPGGIRTLTGVRIAPTTTSTLVAATLSDFLLRPHSYELRSGQPYRRVQIGDVIAGSWPYYPPGYDNVELTGTFGWAAVPDDLATLADMLSVRMFMNRNAGDSGTVGDNVSTVSRFLYKPDLEILEGYRRQNFPRAA